MIKIPLFKVYMSDKVDKPLLETIHSGFVGEGPRSKEFEKVIANRVGNPYTLALSAGTHGLSLALHDIGVGEGDQVITTPLTCLATNIPILHTGGSVVWADINKDDLNIDPTSIRQKITNKTKAIIAMGWAGYSPDLWEIRQIADEYELKVIEDAAHGFGSTYRNSITGDCKFTDYTMISTQAIKVFSTVEGGLLFVNNEISYKRLKLLRWFGIDRESPMINLRCGIPVHEAGFKMQPNDVLCTIGLYNLPDIDKIISIARENDNYYREQLKDFSGLKLIQNCKDRKSTCWLFMMLVEDRSGFSSMMGEAGIHVSQVHEPNDIHPIFRESKCNLPNLDYVRGRFIGIPSGWWVTPEDRQYIVECIKKGW